MSDFVIGLIRTYVPIAVGAAVSFLATKGFALDAETQAGAIVALTGLLQAGYYTGVRLLAERWGFFGVLLGVNKAPTYSGG